VFRQSLWASAGQLMQVLVGLASVLVMASLLGPYVYGVFALAMVMVGLAEVFVGGHAAEVIVQKADLQPQHEAAIFSLQVALGLLSALLIWATGGLVSAWMETPELRQILVGITALPVLTAFYGVPMQKLVRALRFDLLALVNLSSSLSALAVGIGLALSGAGVWSLVAMEMARRTVHLALTIMFAGPPPVLRFQRQDLDDVIGYSVRRIENEGVSYIAKQLVPRLMITRLLGTEALGLYVLALRLVSQIKSVLCDPAAAVVFPLASRRQDDPQRLHQILEAVSRVTTWVAWPVFLCLIAVAPQAVPLTLGADWLALSGVLQFLAVGALRAPVSAYASAVLKANDRLRDITRIQLVNVVLSIAAILLGAQAGILGVAAGLALQQWIVWPLWAVHVSQISGFRLTAQLQILLVAGQPALVMAAVLIAGRLLVAPAGLQSLAIILILGSLAYAASWVALNQAAFRELVAALRSASAGEFEAARSHISRIVAPGK